MGRTDGATTPTEIDADFEQILAGSAPDVVAIARAVRKAVNVAMPGAVEQVDPADGLLAIGTDRTMKGLVFAIVPHRTHVNLQLADGALLPNPDGLIEGTGKRVRHVKVRSVESAGSSEVRRVIDAQIAQRL
jgi:hypothetical protein